MNPSQKSSLPFSEIYMGRVDGAVREVCNDTGIPATAISSARDDLLRLVGSISTWPLLPAFHVFRSSRPAPLSNERDEFTSLLLQDDLRSFFREFPVVSDLVCRCIDEWSAALREFHSRFSADRSDLVAAFGPGAEADIVALDTSLSDHHGGRSVIAVSLASGLRLIYKPRCMSLERGYFDFLDWLNRNGAPVQSRVVRIVDKARYGWAEFVPSGACQNLEEVKEHFARAGALAAVLYVLGGTDAHMGNVIAAGPWPVLVDAECMLQPLLAAGDPSAFTDERILLDLLQSDLFPLPAALCIEPFDLSGLGGFGGQPTDYRVALSDAATPSLRFVPGVLLPQPNLAEFGGRHLQLRFHTDAFVRGFGDMCGFLGAATDRLLAPSGPIAGMWSCETRVLLRTTRFYMALLSRSLRPSRLRSRTARSAYLRQQLAQQKPALGPEVMGAEASALELMNIPYFTTRACGVEVRSEGRRLRTDFFHTSGRDVVLSRLWLLRDGGHERLTSIMRVTLALSYLGKPN